MEVGDSSDDEELRFLESMFNEGLHDDDDNHNNMDEEDDGVSSSEENDDLLLQQMLMFMMRMREFLRQMRQLERIPQRTSILTGEAWIIEVLTGNPRTCHELFRLHCGPFLALCQKLRTGHYLENKGKVSVEEAVTMFCALAGHSRRMRDLADRFQHSLETISRHVRRVMRALCRLGADEILKPTHVDGVHPYVQTNPLYFPWFEKCLGAIDGTLITAWAPKEVLTAYRGRKNTVTQNVLCCCDFDMMFTFVYSGWEGTANDSRVFLDCVTRPQNKFPWPRDGYYYLVDSGFPLTWGFLSPYKGSRYHLADFRSGGNPRGPRELFNYRHSSLRMVIERCFGVLKARFKLLNSMPRFKTCRQALFPIACCVLHNWISIHDRDDDFFRDWENRVVQDDDENDDFAGPSYQYDMSTAAA